MLLATALDQLASGALRRLATAHAVHHDDATTRAELIARLRERFSDTEYLGAQLAALSATEHAALLSTVAAGGEIRRFVLDRDFPDAEAALLERGFLIRTFTTSGRRRGEVFQIPDEVRALLPAPAEDRSAPNAAPAPSPAERRTSDPVFSVFALVSTLQRPSAELEAEVRGWAEEPGGWDWRARWRCLQQLAQACGLLVAGADGRLAPARTLERRLADPPDVAQRLWRAYVETRTWSELSLVEPGVLVDGALPDSVLVRARILELVERLPEGFWFELSAVSDWLRHTAPDFLREHLDPRARLALEARTWEELEGRLVRAIIQGPLYWLGRVAVSADGALLARRPAPAGASLPEPCAWSNGSTLTAGPRADLGALLHAERYLGLEERSRASRYRLDQQHVAGALAGGGSIGECRRLLERLTRGALPPAIEAQLAEWDAAFGALVLRPAVVLEARGEALMDELLTLDAVRPFVRRRLGATVADVPAAEVIGLVDALRAAGHLPRVDGALRLAAEPGRAFDVAGRAAAERAVGPGRAYAGLVDEQVLEFLLVSLLAFSEARPERLAELEGALGLLERLERQFAPPRLDELHADARRLAGDLLATPPPAGQSPRRRRPRPRGTARPRPA